MPFKDSKKRKEYEQRVDVKERKKEYEQREDVKERRREYYQKNKESIIKKSTERNKRPEVKDRRKDIQKKYAKENKEKIAAYHKVWGKEYHQRPEIKERDRIYNQTPERKKYLWEKKGIKGMTIDKFNEMYEEQNGCCGICGRHQNEFKVKLSVDHCHKTEKIRGLLCHHCNKVLGMLKDDINTLYSAIDYLKKYDNEYVI